MKWGQAKASQFKFATENVQVGDHSGLTAYSVMGSGPEEVAIGQKVITANGHFLNGLLGGQQSDGRTMRHGIGQTVLPASTTILTSALALFGSDCAQLEEGKHLWQEISHDVLPHYRRVIFSLYATKQSSANGTLALAWTVDHENVTVTSATADTVTDTSLSMDSNEHADKTFLLRDGDGEDQELTIASNTSDTFTFTTEFVTIPSVGDTGDVLDWQSPTMKRIDTTSGVVTDTGVVRGYAWWERFFVVFRPTTAFNRVYARLRSVSGTLLLDAAQFEEVSRLGAGISTAATATTLTDANRGWVEDAKIGDDIIILDGDDVGDSQEITDNDRTELTAAFATTPSATSVYMIVPTANDCWPTPYQDTSAVSMAFRQITGFDVTAGGTLRVGGIKGSLPRFIVDGADLKAIIIAGDNLDASGFRGMKLLRGVSLALEGGSIIARPDKGSVDSGQRMKLSHEGLMAYNASDVLKLAIYSTGEWEQIMGTSPLQARLVANSTDGFAAYDAQGGKWWGVNPVTKHWWLGEPGGAYAAEFTAAAGLQIHGGALIEGTVVFAGLDSVVTDRMFNSGDLSDDIQAWVHANDVTLIDGGNIYTRSIIGDAISLQSYLSIKSNTWQAEGIQLQYNAGSPRMYVGDGSSKYMEFTSGGDLIVNGAKVTGIAAGSETAIQNWLMDVTFSSSDLNTVAWTSGTLYMLDGTTYSIDSGNTGNMAALTYIYLNIGTSLTVLQTTTTISNTIGSGKILLAVAQNTATSATFQVLGGRGGLVITAGNIAANCIVAGHLVAGTITGTQISASARIVAGTGNNIGVLDGADATYRIYAGHNTPASAPFRVTQAGAMTATSGAIGGWTIDSGKLYSGAAGDQAGMTTADGTYRFYAGHATPASAPFRVSKAGALVASNATITGTITTAALTATAGAIGGWTIAAGVLYSGAAAEQVGLSSADANIRIYAGSATPSNAPFRVGKTGALTATNANITGTLTSGSGTIGGFTLSAGALTNGDLVLSATNQRIEFSTGYFSWGGTRIASNVGLDIGAHSVFHSATVAGTLSAQILAAEIGADITGTMQCDILRIDANPTVETPAATHTMVINLNGTNYKFLCLAA